MILLVFGLVSNVYCNPISTLIGHYPCDLIVPFYWHVFNNLTLFHPAPLFILHLEFKWPINYWYTKSLSLVHFISSAKWKDHHHHRLFCVETQKLDRGQQIHVVEVWVSTGALVVTEIKMLKNFQLSFVADTFKLHGVYYVSNFPTPTINVILTNYAGLCIRTTVFTSLFTEFQPRWHHARY